MGNPLLIAIMAGIVLISVVWGLLRGLAKARIRGICVIACAVLAVILAVVTRQKFVSDAFLSETIIPLLQEAGNTEIVIEALGISDTLNEMLLNCVASLVTPILCLAYFILISFVTWFIFLIVTLILNTRLREYNEERNLSRVRASVWGLVQGLVIAVILLVPVAVYAEVAVPVLNTVLEADVLKPEEEETVQVILEEDIKPLNSGVVKVYRACGGKALCNALCDFEVNDIKVDFSEEVESVTSFTCQIVRLSKTKFENYGSAEAQVFVAIADSFEDSVMLPTIAGEIIYEASNKWIAGEKFLGAAKPTFGDMSAIFDPFFAKLLEVLNTDARNSAALQADIRTVAEMVSIFAENGVFSKLSDTEKLMSALSSDGIVTGLIEKLGSNNSMKVLIPEITNMGMRAIATTLGIPDDVNAVYGDLMADIASAVNYAKDLPEDKQVEQLSKDLVSAFNEAGITTLDTQVIDCYSISMIQDLIVNSEKEDVTADDIQAFFTVYAMNAEFEKGQEAEPDPTEGVADETRLDPFAGTVYEGKTEEELKQSGAAVLAETHRQLAEMEIPEDGDISARAVEIVTSAYANLVDADSVAMQKLNEVKVTKQISADSLKATASMNSSENLMTQKVTLNDLLVDSNTTAENINAETIGKEAEAISSIFSAASSLQKEMNHNGSNMDLNTVAGTVGGILDSLNQTASFGSEKTANLFTAVLQSETVRSSADIDMATATQMAQAATDSSKGEVNYTQTLNTVTGSVDVFTKLGKDGEEVTDEELVELIKNINPQTAGMIEVYATPERIESYKVSPKYSGTSSELITSTFHYMANAEMDDEQYAKEAAALNQTMNIALSAKENSSESHLFTKDGQKGVLPGDAAATVETFMNSHAIGYGLRTTMLNADGTVKAEKVDAFDLAAKLPQNSTDREDCEAAIAAYYDAHKTEENRLTLLALAALLGVDAAEILT